MSDDTLIDARGLATGYGGEAVVLGATLRIAPGEFWAVLGPNGAGKTTLVATLIGLLRPLAGSVARAPDVGDRSGLGFVPQRSELNAHVPTTVREFVGTGLVASRVPWRETAARVDEALATVGIADLRRRQVGELSGGQRQRAVLARALVRRPRLLVVDEPTTGLDPTAQAALSEALGELHRAQGIAVLAVTHDLGLASRLASHIAFVHRGAAHAGARDAMLTPELIEEVFGVRARLEPAAPARPAVGSAAGEGGA